MADTVTLAAKLGTEAGIAAASWAFDRNTAEQTYRTVLRGLEECDPLIMDAYREPSLSGEYADDYDERDLARDLGIEPYTEESGDACDAWQEAASAAFWGELERIARVHVPPDMFTRRRDGIAYLMADGNLRVPCSRYGRNTEECAPVAWRVAYLCAKEQGEPITREALDHAMSMVVNDHDDVRDIVIMLGRGWYGRR